MFSQSRYVRSCSSIPVAIVAGFFVLEWFCYNSLFLPWELGRQGSSCALVVLAVLFNVSWVLALWSYFMTCCTDPGVVPEGWVSQEGYVELGDPNSRTFQPGTVTVCDKCGVNRPERAHHCTICNQCVLRMDHHCPWVGNCVGENNHRFFLLFAFWAFLASLSLCLSMHAQFSDLCSNYTGAPWTATAWPANYWHALYFLVALVTAAILAFMLGCLFLSHTCLIMQNKTTIEANYAGLSPYNSGARANAEELLGPMGFAWLIPIPSSRVSSEHCVEEGISMVD